MEATDVRAVATWRGDLILQVMALHDFREYEISPQVAERLLYDLYGIVQTNRGASKPLRWRDRVGNLVKAAAGR